MKRLLPLLAVLLVGCHHPDETPSSSGEPSPAPAADDDYTKWPSVAEQPYVVDAPVWINCANAARDYVGEREKLRKDHGPHAVHAIVVRVNPTGREAFVARTPVPVGTVVVKEKLNDGKPVAVGTMTKREAGYDAEHGDWEYGYRELGKDAPPASSGKLDTCIACHRIAKERDYLYRPYLKK